jgi:PIN domain nuclease of toxin-antitoxin system
MHIWVEKSKRELLLQEAPFSWEVAQEMRFTLFGHRDSVDWLLLATARVQGLTLVAADERLMRVDGLRVLPNR